jgi:hypothetical protein
MRKLLVGAALALLAASRLHAEPAPAIETIPGPPPEHGFDHGHDGHSGHGPHGPRLFISPSGEPFRGGDGLAAWFAQADADHDGSISFAEFQADAMRAFKLYDANGDGVIDGFEIQAYERERAPEIAEILMPGEMGGERHGGGGGGRRGGHRRGGAGGGDPGAQDAGAGDPQGSPRTAGAGREGAARFSLLNEPEPLLAADEDIDGKVSLAEWTRATARRFAALDHAHTGRLTMADLRPAKPKS